MESHQTSGRPRSKRGVSLRIRRAPLLGALLTFVVLGGIGYWIAVMTGSAPILLPNNSVDTSGMTEIPGHGPSLGYTLVCVGATLLVGLLLVAVARRFKGPSPR